MTQFGDICNAKNTPEYIGGEYKDHTDLSAIQFANKHFHGWRRVDNLGKNGIRIKLSDCSEVLITADQIEMLKH